MAHLSILDYLAGSACLEVDPKIYAVAGDPYALWEDVYKIAPKILAPIREHIREDVASGHSQFFRTAAIATDDSSLPLDMVKSVFYSARTVFEATRIWQREMYEHYFLKQQGLRKNRL